MPAPSRSPADSTMTPHAVSARSRSTTNLRSAWTAHKISGGAAPARRPVPDHATRRAAARQPGDRTSISAGTLPIETAASWLFTETPPHRLKRLHAVARPWWRWQQLVSEKLSQHRFVELQFVPRQDQAGLRVPDQGSGWPCSLS